MRARQRRNEQLALVWENQGGARRNGIREGRGAVEGEKICARPRRLSNSRTVRKDSQALTAGGLGSSPAVFNGLQSKARQDASNRSASDISPTPPQVFW